MRVWALCALLCASLTGCAATSLLDMLPDTGTNVNANGQFGKNNNQTIGVTNVTDQKLVRPQARVINQSADQNEVRADNIESQNIYQMGITPLHVIAAFVWTWFWYEMPSPRLMRAWLGSLFKKVVSGKS